MSLKADLIAVGLAGVVLIGAGWYAKRKLSQAASGLADGAAAALQYVNPADQNNLVNQGFTKAYQWATGSAGTIGTDIYDTQKTFWEKVNQAGTKIDAAHEDDPFGWPI